jgi:hypothetical protein
LFAIDALALMVRFDLEICGVLKRTLLY